MSLCGRMGAWWWGCAALGRRKWAGGDRWTENGCGAVVLHWVGLTGGCGMDGRAGLMARVERRRQALEEKGENECRTYICV